MAETVDRDEARRLLESGRAVLVDVREQHEWDAGHAVQAVHAPIGGLDGAAVTAEVGADVELITTCRSGGRGGRAADTLTATGYRARSLDGGMRGWADAGLPVVGRGGAPGEIP